VSGLDLPVSLPDVWCGKKYNEGFKKTARRNPGLKSNLTEDHAGYYYNPGAVFYH
jgi:hypothetical protein